MSEASTVTPDAIIVHHLRVSQQSQAQMNVKNFHGQI